VRDKRSNTPGGNEVEGERGKNGSGKQGAMRDGESDRTVVDDKIISRASYVICFVFHALNDS
jgi:hypothetical protein